MMRTKWIPRAATRGLVGMLAAAVVGCGGGPPPPADKAEGLAVLKTVLDAWQAGETASSMKDRSPAITAVDPAWTEGTKLARYEIEADSAQPSGHDLGVSVKLWLGDGKKPPVKVRYVIALSPNKVVTRDFGS